MKNLTILAPLIFSRSLFRSEVTGRATLATIAFCLLASGVYFANDWMDRERDAVHPDKCKRPIAAGRVSGGAVSGCVMLLWGLGAYSAWKVNRSFAIVAVSYICLQLLYSAIVKQLVILDVVSIAIGFVLRVAGGAIAINVPISNWLYLCTFLLALFLGFAKRRHELWSLEQKAVSHRAILADYSLAMLDQFIVITAASSILAYALYTTARETIEHVGSDRLKFTVPFVIYGLFRYLYLLHRRNAGGSPERVLLSDSPLLLDVIGFLTVACWGLYY
jgi:4-hydroxybenzoate polyprenyltransferase